MMIITMVLYFRNNSTSITFNYKETKTIIIFVVTLIKANVISFFGLICQIRYDLLFNNIYIIYINSLLI
jgi:hypothetical protein